jgi:hypothetical protein
MVGFVAGRASAGHIFVWVSNRFPILPDRAFPRVFVIGHALLHDRLECGGGQRVATKAKVLNYPVVRGSESAKHEAHLHCRIDGDAPHFEAGKYAREPGFERDDGLVVGLFDINKVEDVAE